MSIVRQGTLPVGSLDHAITLNVQSSGGSHFETVTDTTPYLHRASPQDVASSMKLKKVVGGTVVWNQISTSFSSGNTSRGTLTESDGIYSYTVVTVGSTQYDNAVNASVLIAPIVLNHKYLLMANIKPAHSKSVRFWLIRKTSSDGNNVASAELSTTENQWNEISTICVSQAKAGYFQLSLNTQSSTGYSVGDVDQFKNFVAFDLTQMFGSTIADYIYSLEQAHAGDGVAWFRKLFPKAYYDYNAGELMSVKTSAHKMVGFNALNINRTAGTLSGGYSNTAKRSFEFDKYYVGLSYNNYYNPSIITESHVNNPAGEVGQTTTYNAYGVAFPIKVVPNTTYYCAVTTVKGLPTVGVGFYDADGNPLNFMAGAMNRTFTTPANCHIATIVVYGNTSGGIAVKDININLSSSRNGEYEPYEEHTYPLDGNLTLRGIPKLDGNNELYYDGDTYASDGTVTRKYGIRAYTEGDATDGSTMITDGTNTVYKLITPTTESADAYTQSQRVGATEEFVDGRTVEIPVGNVSEYKRLIQGDTP